MKILAVFMVLVGALAFWAFRPDTTDREALRSAAVAMNFAIFRNAVLDYALLSKTPGTVTTDTPGLNLPTGWIKLRPWQGLIRADGDGLLYCYVFGQTDPVEVMAVQKLFNFSKTVGWNDAGVLVRNGDPLPLPSDVPNNALVSVIRLD